MTEGTTKTEIYTERKTCRSCQKPTLTSVLDLGNQYLPRFVEHRDENLPRAPLHLVRCAFCGLLQLQHTTNADLLYRKFWYRSGINESMREALRDVVRHACDYHRGGNWLDIGANDGYLLSCVPHEFGRVAVEPALDFKAELEEHAERVVMDYFSSDVFDQERFQVITSCAMFYDLDDPATFIRDIHKVLAPGGIWVNQLNDAPTMLKANAFDAICHEHLCYYDLHVLDRMYRENGMTIVSITHNDVNGGSVRVIAQRTQDGARRCDFTGIPRVTLEDADAFRHRILKWKHVFSELLKQIGPGVWCYGASTKGGTLLQYLDLHDQFFAVADRNPRKEGLHMAGSWLPITSESAFRAAYPRYAVVLPWAFKSEFDQRETAARAAGTTFIYPLPEISFVV
jgi:SAM-dependent methyltransferase